MVSVEYFTVFILLMSVCRTSAGFCRCLDQQECPRCVSGCKFGFTGSRCQYANLLAYSSCQDGNAFAADGDYLKCELLRGYFTCTNSAPLRRYNTIRIIHKENTVLPHSFYIWALGGWIIAGTRNEVSGNITEYSFTGNNDPGTILISLNASVCEIEVSYEYKDNDPCALECRCNNASDCLSNTSVCPSGCASGYFEVNGGCQQVCQTGYYGDGCWSRCGHGCKLGNCSHVDGTCECRDGWRGRKCSEKCREGKYGPGCTKTCGHNCISCHHVSGNCGSDCRPEWYGENCTGTCPPGFYGDGCKSECNKGCKPEKCNTTNGRCGSDCGEGWTGKNCIDKCVPGTYGENCVFKCSEGCINQTCDRVSGQCEDCLEGWQHHDRKSSRCDKTCPPGFYGEGCKSECNKGCKPEKCNTKNGVCGSDCKEGWTGEDCIDECVPGTYGENCVFNCSEGCISQTCDKVSGQCEDCLEGWQHHDRKTSRCDKKCDEGYFGKGCNRNCSASCNDQSCYHVTGACLHGCVDERRGIFCESYADTSYPQGVANFVFCVGRRLSMQNRNVRKHMDMTLFTLMSPTHLSMRTAQQMAKSMRQFPETKTSAT